MQRLWYMRGEYRYGRVAVGTNGLPFQGGPEIVWMPRSLVTGGAGYFGEVLAQQLLARGDEVCILDLNPSSLTGVKQFIGDIRDPTKVAEAVEASTSSITSWRKSHSPRIVTYSCQ